MVEEEDADEEEVSDSDPLSSSEEAALLRERERERDRDREWDEDLLLLRVCLSLDLVRFEEDLLDLLFLREEDLLEDRFLFPLDLGRSASSSLATSDPSCSPLRSFLTFLLATWSSELDSCADDSLSDALSLSLSDPLPPVDLPESE